MDSFSSFKPRSMPSIFPSSSPTGVSQTPYDRFTEYGCLLDSSGNIQFLIDNFRRVIDEIFWMNSGGAVPFIQNTQFSAQNASAPQIFNFLIIEPNSYEFQSVFNLLSANGPVMRSVERLTNAEPSLRYSLNVEDIPILCRRGLLCSLAEDEITSPSRTSEKSYNFPKSNSESKLKIQLNPFQYFFARFACHLICAADSLPAHLVSSDYRRDNVFAAILSNYMHYFLPLDGVFPCAQPQIESTNFSQHIFSNEPSSVRHRKTKTFVGGPYGLLKRDFFAEENLENNTQIFSTFQNGQISNNDLRSADHRYSSILWKTYTFFHLIFDAWLLLGDDTKKAVPLPTMDSSFTILRGTSSTSASAVSVIRQAVKHAHRFAYGTSSNFAIVEPQFKEFKDVYVPKFLASRTYAFLEYNFSKWPLDGSFRVVLEFWLTYVQPWRYADYQNRNYSGQWTIFVSAHRHFYGVFFISAMRRLLRAELAANKNAVMLLRLAQVFGQPGLINALNWTNGFDEENRDFFRQNFQRRQSILSRNSIDHGGSFTEYFLDANANDADDLKICIRRTLIYVLEKANVAADQCRFALTERRRLKNCRTWTKRLMSFFDDEDEDCDMVEMEKTCDYLTASISLLKTSFDLNLNEIIHEENIRENDVENRQNTPLKNNLFSTSSSAKNLSPPDCETDERGRLKLTPKGRKQIVNQMRKFDFSIYEYPADLKPISASGEIVFLATFFKFISDLINEKYWPYFEEFYYDDGFKGYVAKKLLEPPTRLLRKNSPFIEGYGRRKRDIDLPSRINLRPMATYRFLRRSLFVFLGFSLFFGFRTAVFIWLFGIISICVCLVFVLK